MKRFVSRSMGFYACVLLVTMVLFSASCKKTSSNPNSGDALFYFHLYPYIDSTPLTDTAALYKDSSGKYIGLNTAQMLIYNVVLQNTNGSSYQVSNAYIITGLDNDRYLVGYAPPGTYNAVSFIVGLDAGTNTYTPAEFTPVGYLPSSTMYYAGGQGYMSMLLLGFADTTGAVTDSGFAYFSYEVSSQLYPQMVTLPTRTGTPYQPYTAVAGGTDTISLICDYGKLLSSLNFKTQDTTDSYYIYPTLADTIAKHVPNMFRYEQ